eukprot:CAMPEP_0194722598 /NCGR_PEP_ID=MMETSP0296-20130528/13674_1 /TAXON_ID=39354 /ORGANISM="Heterosigma akashiwo, Strain CCMP2393" /LENGTH=841 /DNA_ID=CAMNT_0039625643 /DNA_START=102 /DNA_END=2627 /DNA_ORIENTATION=-
MSVVGIDLGNMNAVIGKAGGRRGTTILLNENSNRLNPAMVSFNGAQRFVGEGAASIARSNYKNTIHSLKRLIGRKWSDPELQAEIPRLSFTVVEMPGDKVGVKVAYNDGEKTLCVEHVVAMLLCKLADVAAKASDGVAVADAVVAVPSWFTDAHRRAMKNACEIAGLHVLRLLNETTAAALAYGAFKSAKGLFDPQKPKHVMFVDMGHSGYSATVAAFVQGSLTVKACAYDHNLGGRDMDWAIVEHLAAEFTKKHGHDPLGNKKALLKLYQSAERGKKQLSPLGVPEVLITVECLMEDLDFTYTLTLEKYEELIAPLCARVAAPIQQVLQESGLAPDALDAVEIVGGATRVPAVKRAVAAALALPPTPPHYGLSATMNADEAVAEGATLQCAILSSRFKVKDFAVRDAVPYPVRLSWDPAAAEAGAADAAAAMEDGEDAAAEGDGVLLFRRNEETPKTRRVTFRRAEPFTVSAAYDASAQGLLPPGADLAIAAFRVDGPAAGGPARSVRVNVKHDLHGIVQVSSAQLMEAVEEATPAPVAAPEGKDGPASEAGTPEPPAAKKKKFKKTELTVTVEAFELTRAELEAAKVEEAAMAVQDRLIQETTDKRNELETYLYAMRDKIIGELRPYLEDGVREDYSKQLEGAEEWLYSDEGFDATKAAYASKLTELQSVGGPAEKRQWEHQYRDQTVKQLTDLVEEFKAYANSVDEKYAHIEEEERKKIRDECEATAAWAYDQVEKQGALPLHADPALPISLLQEKSQALRNVCYPIITKPKPAPKKEEKKEEDKKDDSAEAGTEGASKEGDTGDNADKMDTEGEGESAAPMETDAPPEAPAAAAEEG